MTERPIDERHPPEAEWLLPTFEGMHHSDDAAAFDTLDQRCRQLFDWWSSFAPGVPDRDAFDILLFPRLAGVLFLTERTAPGRFCSRIQGEEIRYLLGRDRWPTEFAQTDTGVIANVAVNYERCLERLMPFRFEGPIAAFDKAHAQIQGVTLPLAAAGGRNPYILGCLVRV